MENTDNKNYKGAALITYLLAIVFLLLGLFLPLGSVKGADGILALQTPDVLNKAFGLKLSGGSAFSYSYPVKLFGVIPEFDIGAWFVIAYLLVTAAAIVCLIPALAGNKEKQTTVKITFVIEAIAATILTLFVLVLFYDYIESYLLVLTPSNFNKVWGNNLTVAIVGVILAMVAQRIICNKGSGIIKTVLFILSAAAVLFTVYSVYRLFLQATVRNLTNGIGLTSSIYQDANGAEIYVILHVSTFLGGNYFGDFLSSYNGGLEKTLAVFTLLLGLAVLINFILDLLGIARKTSKFMLKCNQVRYIIEVLLIIAVIALVLSLNYKIGLMIIVLSVLAVASYIINLVRLIGYGKFKARKKKPKGLYANGEESDDYKYYDESEHAAANAEPATETPETLVETRKIIYNVNLYNGPLDDFIKKLSNDERIEFAKIFLEKNNPDLSPIPDYEVGGNNAKFFSNVMIYYARVRDLVTEGLMNKMYKECQLYTNGNI